LKFAAVIILFFAGLAVGFAQPVQDLKFWEERAAQVQVGMRREEVERILPHYVPPGGGAGEFALISGGAQGVTYNISPDYKVILFYDFTGIPRNATGQQFRSQDNRLLAPVKLMPTWTTEQRQVLLAKLDAVLATYDAAMLGALLGEIAAVTPQNHFENAHRIMRDSKFQLLLAALQKIDAAEDKSFDPKDVPMANMAPPQGKDGRLYDSGISPDSIKDPEVRAEYQRMLAANSVKAARYNRQWKILSARRDWLRIVEEFRWDQYGGGVDDTHTIVLLVAAEIKNTGLRKEVTELLAAKK